MRSLLLSFVVLVPGLAFAQQTECTADTDCAPDERCELLDCGPTCDPNDPTCEPIDCGSGGVCVAGEPAPPPDCASDSECSGGDVCVTQTYESCSGGGCVCPSDGDNDPSNDPPCDCPPIAPEECTTQTVSFCGPAYLDACAVDADCGAGFTCEAAEQCVCSVSSDETAPADCFCETSDERTCVLIRQECDADADCADGLVCIDEGSSAPCVLEDGGDVSCEARDTNSASICAPEGYVGTTIAAGERDLGDDLDADGDGVPDSEEDDGFDCSQSGRTAPFAFGLLLLGLGARRRR